MKMGNGGLESLALALILAPDPVTTIIGLGILAYARCAKSARQASFTQRPMIRDKFSDLYTCKVHMKDGKTLSYQVLTKREGQLPPPRLNTGKLYGDKIAWNAYRQVAIRETRAKRAVITGQKPSGLLNRPNVMNHTRLVEPQRPEYKPRRP